MDTDARWTRLGQQSVLYDQSVSHEDSGGALRTDILKIHFGNRITERFWAQQHQRNCACMGGWADVLFFFVFFLEIRENKISNV